MADGSQGNPFYVNVEGPKDQNATTPLWAINQTIQSLVAILGSGGDDRKTQSILRRMEGAATGAAANSDLTREQAGGVLDQITSKAGDFVGMLGKSPRVFGNMIDSATRLDGTFRSTLSAMGVTGIAAGALAGAIDSTTDTYRNMMGAGVIFEKGMFDMAQTIYAANMGMREFETLIARQGEVAASVGAPRLAQFAKAATDSLAPLGMLGMTMDEVRETLGEFADMQRRQGVAGRLNEAETTQRYTDLMKNITGLSAATGKTRDAIFKDSVEMSKETKNAAMLRQLRSRGLDKAADNYQRSINDAASLNKDLQVVQDGVRNVLNGNAVASGASAEQLSLLARTIPGFESFIVQYAKDVEHGTVAEGQLVEGLTRLARQVDETQLAGLRTTADHVNTEWGKAAESALGMIESLRIIPADATARVEAAKAAVQNQTDLNKVMQNTAYATNKMVTYAAAQLAGVVGGVANRVLEKTGIAAQIQKGIATNDFNIDEILQRMIGPQAADFARDFGGKLAEIKKAVAEGRMQFNEIPTALAGMIKGNPKLEAALGEVMGPEAKNWLLGTIQQATEAGGAVVEQAKKGIEATGLSDLFALFQGDGFDAAVAGLKTLFDILGGGAALPTTPTGVVTGGSGTTNMAGGPAEDTLEGPAEAAAALSEQWSQATSEHIMSAMAMARDVMAETNTAAYDAVGAIADHIRSGIDVPFGTLEASLFRNTTLLDGSLDSFGTIIDNSNIRLRDSNMLLTTRIDEINSSATAISETLAGLRSAVEGIRPIDITTELMGLAPAVPTTTAPNGMTTDQVDLLIRTNTNVAVGIGALNDQVRDLNANFSTLRRSMGDWASAI